MSNGTRSPCRFHYCNGLGFFYTTEPGVLPVVVIHPGSTSPKSTGGHTTAAQPTSTSILGEMHSTIRISISNYECTDTSVLHRRSTSSNHSCFNVTGYVYKVDQLCLAFLLQQLTFFHTRMKLALLWYSAAICFCKSNNLAPFMPPNQYILNLGGSFLMPICIVRQHLFTYTALVI